MKQAWELAREKTDGAVPRLLTEEEQTWEANTVVGEAEDAHLRLLWNSHVPGSNAPESIMLAAVQAKENLGFSVRDGVALWEEGQRAAARDDMPELNRISAALWQAVNEAPKDPSHPSWGYRRYQSWEEARAAMRLPAAVAVTPTEKQFYAGWLAQIIGGAIGTMIEGYTTDAIRRQFGEVRGYLRQPNTMNDDITYELAFLDACERAGTAVSARDIALAWTAYIPSGWSAEEIALGNIAHGVLPPESGRRGNPFCEWIGAQMRGAVCGMLAPGDPSEAARLAWLDGEVSHASNGILGEVYNALLVSGAFAGEEPRQLVQSCAEMLPQDSEYSVIVNFALDACRANDGWEAAWRRCEKRAARYNWIHAYPNAMAEVVALWYGNGDFDETAYIIAMEGQDVDCNAAQILTVIGILRGLDGIRPAWREPIGDRLDTYMRAPYRLLSIRDLARRTAVQAARFAAAGK